MTSHPLFLDVAGICFTLPSSLNPILASRHETNSQKRTPFHHPCFLCFLSRKGGWGVALFVPRNSPVHALFAGGTLQILCLNVVNFRSVFSAPFFLAKKCGGVEVSSVTCGRTPRPTIFVNQVPPQKNVRAGTTETEKKKGGGGLDTVTRFLKQWLRAAACPPKNI